MKLIIFLSLAGFLALCSCSKIIHPHEEVMSSFKTKEDVKKQFGIPDEKRELNEVTEWLYNCDTISAFTASKTKVRMHGTYNTVYGSLDRPSTNVTEFTHYISYVKFDFDKQGKVIGWDSREVNFAEKRIRPGATAAVVIGSVVGVLYIAEYLWLNNLLSSLGKSSTQ
ncbi:hypothetical protein [Mucilaginibacter aquaedulcis]|uniref:hypothetical protein n=1 Tax=Mucilaginibacter aquaedulcis TaxID=1187081 RepID=UPI0025B5BB6F|nr:hypothetical protein [Mucilaginibacter aquaedulcis]MDN3549805.1 hypothetical protein [Mucilaginibacter aquaedulcis]